MPRRKYELTLLGRYRKQRGQELQEYAEAANLSRAVVLRIENGDPVMHATLAKYLKAMGVDMNAPHTFPSGLQIIDVEDKVRVQLTPQQ